MSRTVQFLILVVAAAGALFMGIQLADRHSDDARAPAVTTNVPDTFTDVEMPDVSGATRNINEWQGKTVLVNFWATWCAPCREEIPVFSAIGKAWADRGLEVVGIALDDMETVRRFGDEVGLDYHSLVAGRDGGYALLETHNPTGALPFSLLIDQNGRILERKLGLWHAADLEASLRKLLPD